MHPWTAAAFGDELVKIAASKPSARERQRVEQFFSSRAGKDKWDRMVRWAQSPGFVRGMNVHPDADEKLMLHALYMHQLQRGKPLGKVKSSTTTGKTYEIRKLPRGVGCTCPDWRYRGSVNPGYQCKHIKAYKEGKAKA